MLEYSLTENFLTERPDDYSAQTHSGESYDKEAIISLILRSGNTLTRTDLLAAFNAMEESVVQIVEQGGQINTPLLNISFSISGVFDGPLDSFDPNRHKLNVNTTKGTLLRSAEKRIKPQKTQSVSPQPNIQEVKDTVSGKFNEVLTPNGVVEIRGYNIKLTGENPACGLWFVPETGEAVKAEIFVDNKPSTVIAMIPALAAGVYSIRIVTQYSGGKDLREPKTVTYSKELEVK